MKKKLLFDTVFFLLLIFSGCKKENTSPVSEVTDYTFKISSWKYSSPKYYTDLSVPELTSSNLNSVAVMVYFSTTGNSWTAIPFTQYHSPYNYYMGFSTQSGIVQVSWIYDSSLSMGTDPNDFYSATSQFKVVVIDKAARMANEDVDLTNYEEVKSRFKLAD